MPVRNSISLKIKLTCLTLLAAFSLVRLSSEDVRKLSAAELTHRLREADFSFLRDSGFLNLPAGEILALGAEAPYYLTFIYDQLDMPEAAARLRGLAADKSRGVWREAASLELSTALVEEGEFRKVEKLARRLLRAGSSGLFGRQSRRLLLEALYRQSEDRELLRRLGDLPPEELDAELQLFAAVAACRRGLPDWTALFRRLFFQEAAGPVHLRAMSFLELEERRKGFTSQVWDCFRAKALLYRGLVAEAVPLLESSLSGLKAAETEPERLIAELGAAYFVRGDLRSGAEFLLALAADPGAPGFELPALEMAGRLLRKAGDTLQAAALLGRVAAESPDIRQRDRAAWFVLDMAFKQGDWRAVLASLAPGWSDPEYFADLLHRQTGAGMAAESWEDLRALYEICSRHGPEDVRVRLAYLLGRGAQLGFFRFPGREAEDLLAEAAGPKGSGYYALLACAQLPRGNTHFCGDLLFPGNDAAGAGLEIWETYPAPGMSPRDLWLAGFFHYGLALTGYEKILIESGEVSDLLLFNASRWLRQQGHVLQSIRLAALLAARGSVQEPALLYPRAFAGELETQARQAGISTALIYALVREESHFDPRIVSSAGAVGLTQLMPATAQDLAGWLRVQEDPEGRDIRMEDRLTDPDFNLRLGVYHLNRLLTRVEESPALALMAYNAGLSRLRSWQRRFAGLPADLLTEALPYPETRGYVQKITVSAAAYASLLAGVPPAETVRYIFPELKGIQP